MHLTPVRDAGTGAEESFGQVIPLERTTRARVRGIREHEEVMLEALPVITYLRQISGSQRAQRADAYVFLSRQIERILGFTREEWSSIPRLWAAQLHPEDRTRVLAEHARHILDGDPFVAEYRIRRQDGSDRWLWHEAEIHRSPHLGGRVTLGVAVDVTDLRSRPTPVSRTSARGGKTNGRTVLL